ncbi:MAG: hypothetical protein M5R40_20535 [Anaerolineae bacterium]|nr:hypothetical protein [Anaerolineae bacterium]
MNGPGFRVDGGVSPVLQASPCANSGRPGRYWRLGESNWTWFYDTSDLSALRACGGSCSGPTRRARFASGSCRADAMGDPPTTRRARSAPGAARTPSAAMCSARSRSACCRSAATSTRSWPSRCCSGSGSAWPRSRRAPAALGAEVAHWKAVALAHDHYWRDLAADVRGNGRAGLKERVRLALRLLAVLIAALTGLAVGVLLIARHVGL